MTKDEFKIIIAALKSNYKKFGIENEQQFLFWYEMLKDIDFILMQAAIKKLVCESTFAPTIADIRKRVSELTMPDNLDPIDAWGQVQKAIGSYGMYRCKEALENMDNDVAQIVKSMGWENICMSDADKMSVVRGQFIKIYQTKTERKKQESLLPDGLKDQIKGFSEKMMLE